MSNQLLDIEVQELEQKLITMASLAEQSVNRSAQALLGRDEALAEQVEKDDSRLDEMEVIVDQAVFTFLYRQRPVAHDLRLALAATKISTDLERIGDASVAIARCAKNISVEPEATLKTDIADMARIAGTMLRDVISCFGKGKVEELEEIILRDKKVDALHHQLNEEVATMIQKNPDSAALGIQWVIAVRNLERIGDHSKNIAEELIFVAKAIDVRHTQEGANQPA